MVSRDQVDSILIKLIANNKEHFYLLLDRFGSINRSGSGKMVDEKDDLYIGITKEPIFQKLNLSLSDGLLAGLGKELNLSYKFKDDIPCKLELLLKIGERSESVVIKYGYRSGLPTDVAFFLKEALELTNSWYMSQKSAISDSAKK